MKTNCVSLVLSFCLVSATLLSQKDAHEIDSIAIDIEQLSEEIKDSVGLEGVIEKILNYSNDPLTSLRYVLAYENIAKEKPYIPNRLERVYYLKGNRYNSLAWSHNQSNISQALLYIDTALMWHEKANSDIGYWQDQYGLGVIYRNKGLNDKALAYFDSYYEHYQEPFDSIFIANVQFQRAVCFFQLGKLEQASEAILEAIELEEHLGREFSLATNLNSLAIIKKKSKLFNEVLPLYDRAYSIRKKLDDTEGQGNVLYNKALFLVEQGKSNDAISVFREAEAISKGENLLSYIYEGLGSYFLNMEKIDSADYYLNKCYALRENSGSEREIYIVKHKLGQLNARRGYLDKAVKDYQFALEYAEKQGEKDKISEILLDYANVLERQGRFEKANSFLKKHIEVKDSLVNASISESVEELTVKYDTEKKENEIIRLNSQNELAAVKLAASKRINLYLALGVVLFGILTAFILIQANRIRLQNRLISDSLSEKDTLLREIHHRVKNNLQVISALLTLQSSYLKDAHAKEALQHGQDRVQSMALIHKDLYQHDNLKGVNTKDYLEQLIDNLFQSYQIDEGSIELKTDIQALNLDVDTMIPLGLIINELISNALKHAFNRESNNRLFISLREASSALYLTIKDNGKGVEDIDLMKKQSFGYSLINSFARRLDAQVQITNDDGLSVEFVVHNYQKV